MSQHVYSMPNVGHDRKRVTVEDAARLLRISENAVRKRIERGTLDSERYGDTRYVLLDGDMPQHANGMSDSMPVDIAMMQAHLDSQQEQIEFLRRELERKDALLLNMTEAMKALSSPSHERSSDERESPLQAAEPRSSTATPADAGEAQEGAQRRGWFRRWFGL